MPKFIFIYLFYKCLVHLVFGRPYILYTDLEAFIYSFWKAIYNTVQKFKSIKNIRQNVSLAAPFEPNLPAPLPRSVPCRHFLVRLPKETPRIRRHPRSVFFPGAHV